MCCQARGACSQTCAARKAPSLPKLAAPAPILLALPSAYMKQFHASYTDAATLAKLVARLIAFASISA